MENGSTATSRKFSKEFDSPLSDSIIRTAAIESKKRSITEITDHTALFNLPPKKRGCPLLLLGGMDGKAQAYIRNVRDRGCPVTSSIVIAVARGVVKKMNRMLLENKGVTIQGFDQLTAVFGATITEKLLPLQLFIRKKLTSAIQKLNS